MAIQAIGNAAGMAAKTAAQAALQQSAKAASTQALAGTQLKSGGLPKDMKSLVKYLPALQPTPFGPIPGAPPPLPTAKGQFPKGQNVEMVKKAADYYKNNGYTAKAKDLRQIVKIYDEVSKMPKTSGYNCTSFTHQMMDAMKKLNSQFGKNGSSPWRVDSIGFGKQDPDANRPLFTKATNKMNVGSPAYSDSYAHQAVTIIDRKSGKPVFVLDPTKMAPGGQGLTDGWDQAYKLKDWLNTRHGHYCNDQWTTGVQY